MDSSLAFFRSLRGGGDDDVSETDDEVEVYDATEEDEDEDEYDEYDEYETEEDEGEEEAEEETNTGEEDTSVKEYDEIMVPSPFGSIMVTVGTMYLTRHLDMSDPKIIKIARAVFMGYIILMNIFLFFVQIRARLNNDRTTITLENPISNLVQSQLNNAAGSGGGDTESMVKGLANRFLQSQSTIMEYDKGQANQARNGLIPSMMMMWVLHFKMGQVQPLFLQAATGLMNLVYSPLFQVYVLGKELERPFKIPGPMDKLTESAAAAEEEEKEESSSVVEQEEEEDDDTTGEEDEEEDEDVTSEDDEDEEATSEYDEDEDEDD